MACSSLHACGSLSSPSDLVPQTCSQPNGARFLWCELCVTSSRQEGPILGAAAFRARLSLDESPVQRLRAFACTRLSLSVASTVRDRVNRQAAYGIIIFSCPLYGFMVMQIGVPT